MAKGKKTCPNCNTEIGARLEICGCGWYFLEKTIRADLLEEKKNKLVEKTKQAEEKEKNKLEKKPNFSPPGKRLKQCPNCNKGIGNRTMLCECGWYFPGKEVRMDLLEEKKNKIDIKKNSPGKRVKQCPNCKKETGHRKQLCECGWYYPEEKIRQDLLDEKQKKSLTNRLFDEEGPGRKKCPSCNIIIAARVDTCFKCGYDFAVNKVKKEKEVDEEKLRKREDRKKKADTGAIMSSQTSKILAGLTPYKAPPVLTKKDHAERILSYGKERAGVLLQQARLEKCWSHVDWDYVEQKLTG